MSRVGFFATCQDCPTMIGEDYGELIKNGVQTLDQSPDAFTEVKEWARIHKVIEDGHRVTVGAFCSMDVSLEQVNPEVVRRILGG